MSVELFSSEQQSDHMEAGRKGAEPWRYRTFAEINHEAARYIVRKLEGRRRTEGVSTRIGRIGLVGTVGTNRSEKELRYPNSAADSES